MRVGQLQRWWRQFSPKGRFLILGISLVCLVIGVALPLLATPSTAALHPPIKRAAVAVSAITDDWSTYHHDNARSGFSADTNITPANAGRLHQSWSYQTGGSISAGAIVANGTLYVGSWDGYEYALNATTGALIWKTKLGQNNAPKCWPNPLGVMATATFVSGELYVSAGDGYFYAINGSTGAIDWKILVADTTATGGYGMYSSPIIDNNVAYIGLSSDCDNPNVQGKVLRIDLTLKVITHTFLGVPNGKTGATIWGAPALDSTAGLVYVATGNGSTANPQLGYAESIVAVNAADMTFSGAWQIPLTDFSGLDQDFGSSPVLFTTTAGVNMVAAVAKNGIFYGVNLASLATGLVWNDAIAIGGEAPETGNGSIATAASANGIVYVGGGNTTINTTSYKGSIRAVDPTTGNYLWQHGSPGYILSGVAYANGMVIDGAGNTLEVLDANSGQLLFAYPTSPINSIYAEPTIAEGMIFFSTSDGVLHALTITGATSGCPTGWNCADIGAPGLVGSETADVAANTWTMNGSGADIWGTADQFHYAWQTLAGDGTISSQVTAQTNTDPFAKAGDMIRLSNAPSAPYYFAAISPAHGIMVQYRATQGGAATEALKVVATVPTYIRVGRSGGTTYSTYTSVDGVTWTLVNGSTVVIPALAGPMLGGLAVTAHNNAVLGAVTLSHVAVNGSAPPPPPQVCPTGWTCGDIGGPGNIGTSSLNTTTGIWTVNGGGADIWGTSDQFQYVWQSLPGDGGVSAQVQSQTKTDPFAKAGVMVRANANPASAYYAALISPNNGILIQYRSASGNQALEALKIPGTPPAYLQIVRNGTTFTTATSPDGITWTTVAGSAVVIPALGGTILGGLAVTAHNNTLLSTAIFGAVSIGTTTPLPTPTPTTPPTPLPTPTGNCPVTWTCNDIGNPGQPGSASLNTTTNVWAINGGGADIWGTADQFQLDWQTLAGDGTLSAHVASQTNTDPYAKAGIMFRLSTDPAAPYFFAAVTPANGIMYQYRTAQGTAALETLKTPGTVPAYLRIKRLGTTYAAYTSADGMAWTLVAGSTVTLPNLTGNILAGLAVTAHNTTLLSTATIDSVGLATSPVSTEACPTGWNCADLGATGIAGAAALNTTTGAWTITGSGADIWGTSDQFQYIWSNMPLDSTVSTHLTSQSNTDPYAKAGVMMRQSTDPSASYYFAAMTPTNGILIQYRTATGVQAQEALKVSGGVPIYLRIQKQATTFMAATSTDGVTWTTVAGSTVKLAFTGNYLAGLAVTAHTNATSSTVVMDSVTVTAP